MIRIRLFFHLPTRLPRATRGILFLGMIGVSLLGAAARGYAQVPVGSASPSPTQGPSLRKLPPRESQKGSPLFLDRGSRQSNSNS